MTTVIWDSAGDDAKALNRAIEVFQMIDDAFAARCGAIDNEANGDQVKRDYLFLLEMQKPAFVAFRRLADAVMGLQCARDYLEFGVATRLDHASRQPYHSIKPTLVRLDAAIVEFFQVILNERAALAIPLALLDNAARAVEDGRAKPAGFKGVMQ